ILDMPDEILIKIFEHVKGWQPDEQWFSERASSVDEIKNLRLTCRRFCNTTSHLLMHFVIVELNPSSLYHLEEVSRHPTISKGILCVRVVLSYYDSYLADNIDVFASHHAHKLSEATEFAERTTHSQADLYNVPEEIIIAGVKKAWKIIGEWRNFHAIDNMVNEDSHDEPGSTYRKVLRRGYEEYRKHYVEQERLRKEGAFIKAVAEAFARMPAARRLELWDAGWEIGARRRYVRTWLAQMSDDESLRKNMLVH
ncbi:hypothetical protein N431DRAFT_358420, partial [Stipitochalara longipes BDJ]